MSRTTGYVDENGALHYRIEYDLKRPWDMSIITKTSENPERTLLS
jgi:hypothetical protein